jgi:glycosyltransferase involved in cell wall biosynthesis
MKKSESVEASFGSENPVPGISAVVITLNAQSTIVDCLRSLRWTDEILVVDSYSTDRTVEIAKELADRVELVKWRGFSEQKNYAASLARFDWILSVDADEVVSSELAREASRLVTNAGDIAGFWIPRQTFWLGHWIRHGGWYPDFAMRLYRKSMARWEGVVHEKVVSSAPVRFIGTPLQHYSYRSVQDHLERMTRRLVPLETQEAIERGIRIYKIFPFAPLWKLVRSWWGGPRNAHGLREAYKEVFKNRVEIAWLIPVMPLLRFLYMYVFRLGFLDGMPGFWVAVLSGFYEAARLAKIWEYRHRGQLSPRSEQTLNDIHRV